MFSELSQEKFRRAGSVFGGIAGLVFFSSCAVAQTSVPYGPNDRLGALNNLSPEIVLRAASLIKTGKVYSLALATKPQGATGIRHYHSVVQAAASVGLNKLTSFEDMVILSPSLGTSMDGLGHVGRDGIHYNGVRAEDVYSLKDVNSYSGAKIFSIDTLPPIVTRGVLLDVGRHREGTRAPSGMAITQTEIEAIAKAQSITIRRGDVVLLHAGRLRTAGSAQPDDGHPGLSKDGARYLANLGVVAVGGDAGNEVSPAETEGEFGPVHQILLVDHGVYILEGVQTQELAFDRAYEFLFMAAAPRLVGTVQATIHPIAIR